VPTPHYRKPGWFTHHVFNPTVAFLTRRGLSVWGSRVLEVRGRTSGEPRRTPVNLLTLDGRQYLVSPRGEGQWVRNVRAADGRLATLLGKRREEWTAHELGDADKVPVLRAYLRRWKAEVGVFFDGTSADSSDDELAAIAPRHPVFALEPVETGASTT
jgi:deazaflavin-dependent oxidoreductase (nitroreductase family)